MKRIPLRVYVEINGQSEAARALGVTQPAIRKAIQTGRNIYIFYEDGKVKAEEIRHFPSVKGRDAS